MKNLRENGYSEELSKIPPQAIDLEESIIGSLLSYPGTFIRVSGIIKAESFYKEEHQKIFEIIKTLSVANKPIDLLIVQQILRNNEQLDLIGGPLYLTQLSGKGSHNNIESHAKIIQDKFIKRELIKIGTQISQNAYDETIDVEDSMNTARVEINNIDNINPESGKSSKEVAKLTTLELEKDVEEIKKGNTPGIPTGFSELDLAIGGWKAPNFTIIAARPGVGKTSIGIIHFAIIAAKAGYWVNIYTYEMSSSDLFRIILSAESDVNRTKIRDGRIDDHEWHHINKATDILAELPILWYDDPTIKASTIRANTIRNKSNGKCDLVIGDYLQRIPVEDKRISRDQQVGEICKIFKQITMPPISTPVIALAQLNREIEKRPNPEAYISDIRESGEVEQEADIITLLYLEEEQLKLKIAKNRRGKLNYIDIYPNSQMTKFSDCIKEPIQVIDHTQSMRANNNFDNEEDDLPY